ncbi:MAG: glycoside hydrolase family 26 protein [Prevotellaceae bacterium]|nr:glycoside hydrolase family 26 protein [Prevotellaceae bacterium]
MIPVLASVFFWACTPATRSISETEQLLKNLQKLPATGFMFGHQDDTVYGIGWDGAPEQSDVKRVCGDYPAVMGFDLGQLELDDTLNLDKVPFASIRREIINQYQRGGLVTLSWHARNPLTGGDAWDVSDSTVVQSILSGGTNQAKFEGWMEQIARFLNTLKSEDGTSIPVLFRPWHEQTGYEGIPDPNWWTKTLLPALGKYPIAYVLVWRNARERVTHFFAPYPGQASAVDFEAFYQQPKTLFAADVNLYE